MCKRGIELKSSVSLFFAVNFQNPYLFYQKIWKGAGIKPG